MIRRLTCNERSDWLPVAAEEKMNAMLGPGKYDQWLKWTSRTAEQQNRVATCHEMEKLLLPGKVNFLGRDL